MNAQSSGPARKGKHLPLALIAVAMLSVPLAVASAAAQTAESIYQRACGPKNTWFNIELHRTKQASAMPEPGRALVYIVQDFWGGGPIDTRIGLDGAWVGAIRNISYFVFSVAPGEHHLCANRQVHALGRALLGGGETELAHFTAEAGKAYYFRATYVPMLLFGPVDGDQAQYMIASDRLSVATPQQ